MSTTTWLVTGTSRGIGLEIVRQLLALPGSLVIASCRNPDGASKLKALPSESSAKGTLEVIKLDMSDQESIKAGAQRVREIVGSSGLDYLVNNAASTEGDVPALSMSIPMLLDTLRDNVAGPALLTQQVLPLLELGKKKTVVHVSSGLASFALDFGHKNASYSISKTALNMLMYKQAAERKDIMFFTVDPGWVKTDMGGPGAMLEPHESVSGLVKLFTSATPATHSGKFFNYKGEVQPW